MENIQKPGAPRRLEPPGGSILPQSGNKTVRLGGGCDAVHDVNIVLHPQNISIKFCINGIQ